MRKPVIAGNWKMFKSRDEALKFVYSVNQAVPSIKKVESVICAPFVFLRCLVKRQGDNLRIGAQNMHYANEGAYTGEISGSMLTCIDVSYVIIGHSERRAYFNETDEAVNKKLNAAFKHKLTPILCIGELLEEREKGQTEEIITRQLTLDLVGIDRENIKKLIIAYEPIWAIGTGKTATPEMAEEACGFIRKKIAEMYDFETADAIRIQYGGSVKVSNIDDLMKQPNIDGALIGGASLIAEDFVEMVKSACKIKND